VVGLIALAIMVYEIFSRNDALPQLIVFLMIILYTIPSFGPELKSGFTSLLGGAVDKNIAYNQELNDIDFKDLENVGENSMSIRVNIIKNTFAVFNENKTRYINGVGAGGIESYMAAYDNTGGVRNLHNWWLEIFANFGILGASMIAYFSLFLFWQNLKIFHKNHNIYSFFAVFSLAMLAVAALSPSSLVWQVYPWFVYSFAAVNYLIQKDKDENPDHLASISEKK
jgi:hypothetical protein